MESKRTLAERVSNRWRRFAIGRFARRDFRLDTAVPYVSFTFDDFPLSALVEGGRILCDQGVRGTYFVSLKLLGAKTISGIVASREDLAVLLQNGHELGCHTFEHLDGCRSTVEAFERSIEANRSALAACVPGAVFQTFAYPLNGPVLAIKQAVGGHFVGCRGGGQSFNSGVIDLNLLKSYFLDERNRDDMEVVRTVIEKNAAARGWLIFSTHDVGVKPSRYGCEPQYLKEVVRLALQSGARVRPMMQACRELGIG